KWQLDLGGVTGVGGWAAGIYIHNKCVVPSTALVYSRWRQAVRLVLTVAAVR
ncbi:hypothetical protein BgiMline_000365, partial [Biomphalaria glabrata]